MKKLLYISILTFSLSLIAQEEKQVLFIGNSYTYANNLPDLIHQIALTKGNSLSYNNHTPGGSTLFQHASNANVQSLFASNQWDYVVLQEQSQRPAFPPNQVADEVYPYAESLCTDMREENTCVQPVFFMTWGRENGDQQNCQNYTPLCTYEGMQDRLTNSYTEMAQDNEALLAPVGLAWKNIRAAHPQINLYTSDGSHPSIQGSYLAACVFYAVLFNDSPINEYIPNNLSEEEAEILQTFASEALNNTNTDFTIKPEAIANYELIGDSLHLYNQSSNADSINWVGISQNIISFEDTLIIDLTGYSGNYEINLVAKNQCFESELLIQLNNLQIQENINLSPLYPNPSTGILKCNTSNYHNISVYNQLGICLYKKNLDSKISLDLSHIPEGLYTIFLTEKNGKQRSYSWVKKN